MSAGLADRMNMQLVEPLRELFKDEVRALGRELGLPESFIGRHRSRSGPCHSSPGGVYPRKAGHPAQGGCDLYREIRKAGLYDKIWQAFSVLLPVQTVGVMGDGPAPMTGFWHCAPSLLRRRHDRRLLPLRHGFLGRTATRIINEVKGVNRVVYDVTSKPPGTIEWE